MCIQFHISRWTHLSMLALATSACPGLSASGAEPVRWERHAVELPNGVPTVSLLDTDGDGHLEIAAFGGQYGWLMRWPKLEPVVIFDAKDAGFMHSAAGDFDGDGNVDLAVTRFNSMWPQYRRATAEGKKWDPPKGPDGTVFWLENTGAPATWKAHVLDADLNQSHGVIAADFDGDGKVDLAANNIGAATPWPNSVFWYAGPFDPAEAPGVRRKAVTEQRATGRSHYFAWADIDGDGKKELLLTGSASGELSAWKPGADVSKPWTGRVIWKKEGLTNVVAADIDGDGQSDLAASCGHGTGVYWLKGPSLTESVVDADIKDAHALTAADFDGDGDVDLAAVSFSQRVVRWYENRGAEGFAMHAIAPEFPQQAYDMRAGDVDGDGRIDLVVAGRSSNNVVVFINRAKEDKAAR